MEGMLDCARGLALAEIEHQKDDRAVAPFYRVPCSDLGLSIRPEPHDDGR